MSDLTWTRLGASITMQAGTACLGTQAAVVPRELQQMSSFRVTDIGATM